MKKLLATVLAASLAVSLCACGGGGEKEKEGTVSLPKSIEVQVPASAGGGTDVAVRALTNYINQNSETNMTVVNNTDGGGVVAYETARTAKGDGSKILFFHTSMLIKSAIGLYDKHAADDFKVIGVGQKTDPGGYVLVVNPDSGITDLEGFIAAAKEKDGELMIGVETGGSSHIMAGIMAKEMGIKLNYVEAGPDTEKLTALVGGSIDCALVNQNQAKQYIESSKVNALGSFAKDENGERNTILPDVPTFVELGYKGCVYTTNMFVLATPEMDDATAEALRDLFAAAADDEETTKILQGAGLGLKFAAFTDGQKLIADQQEQLNTVCEELGLVQK